MVNKNICSLLVSSNDQQVTEALTITPIDLPSSSTLRHRTVRISPCHAVWVREQQSVLRSIPALVRLFWGLLHTWRLIKASNIYGFSITKFHFIDPDEQCLISHEERYVLLPKQWPMERFWGYCDTESSSISGSRHGIDLSVWSYNVFNKRLGCSLCSKEGSYCVRIIYNRLAALHS